MPYDIPANGIVEIQALGRLHGQRTRNTFKYRYAGVTPLEGVPTIEALIDEFREQIFEPIVALLSNEYMLEVVTGQLIRPIRHRVVSVNVGLSGGVAGNSLPSTSCVVIRRFAESAGRRFQGRVFIPGIPTSSELDSKLAPAVFPDWFVVAANLMEPLEGGTQTEPFVNVVAVRNPVATIDDTAGTFLDTVLRVQRRREIGVGE